MVDIHCHILPGVDDGAENWDRTVAMCQMALEDGITHIVATPHANHAYSYDRRQNQHLLAELRTRIGSAPVLSLGCDFHFSFDNVESLRRDPTQFTIGETGYLLVELSDYSIPPNFGQHLFELLAAGICPVITHPERYALLQKRPQQILDWAAVGALIQITANSTTGHWGKAAQKLSRWLLDHDAVHVIATDAHDTEGRPPLMSSAFSLVSQWKGLDIARALVEDNPAAIVRGEPLPYAPLVKR